MHCSLLRGQIKVSGNPSLPPAESRKSNFVVNAESHSIGQIYDCDTLLLLLYPNMISGTLILHNVVSVNGEKHLPSIQVAVFSDPSIQPPSTICLLRREPEQEVQRGSVE